MNNNTILILILLLAFYYYTQQYKEDFESIHSEFPLLIFQTWKTKIQNNIPYNMRKWSNSWKKYNPNYQYILWDDLDNRNFIKQYYPWFLPKYDSYDVNIKRVDAVRYFFLYHYGGIYADMDFECLKNFDTLLNGSNGNGSNSDIIFGKMSPLDHANNIPNALMISKPKQKFWLFVFYLLLLKPSNGHVESTTGPILLKEALDLYNKTSKRADYLKETDIGKVMAIPEAESKITILEPVYFYPIDWTNESHQKEYRLPVLNNTILDTHKEFPNSYAVTFWSHTW